jgi:hypothetical protein
MERIKPVERMGDKHDTENDGGYPFEETALLQNSLQSS